MVIHLWPQVKDLLSSVWHIATRRCGRKLGGESFGGVPSQAFLLFTGLFAESHLRIGKDARGKEVRP